MDLDLTHIDMEDIGYDDVLQMHRGWRRSETELQSTLYELNTLKIKFQQMQDSHARFLHQIESLESIRDFNTSLQDQMERIEREKLELHEVNVQLIHSKSTADLLLNDLEGSAARRDRQTREARLENDITREQYREVAESHRELEIMISNELKCRKTSEARLVECDKLIDSLRLENASIRLKLDSTLIKMNQCDHELAYASLQLSKLAEKVAAVKDTKDKEITTNIEVLILKRDISRLLKLLEHYPASKSFRRRWSDSHGMSFLGSEFHEGSVSTIFRSPAGEV